MTLPPKTQDYITHGAHEGQRNEQLFAAAAQIRDAGMSQAAAEVELMGRALADGLNESEAKSTIASAFRGAKREPIGYGAAYQPVGPVSGMRAKAKVKKPQKKIEPKTLPDIIENGLETLIKTCFRPGEYIAIGDTNEIENGVYKPSAGSSNEYNALLVELKDRGHINKIYSDKEGLYIRVNPLELGGNSDKEVTAFRHVLVEFDKDQDGNTIPKELQYAAIIDSGFPVSAIIDSGNKSIHAWVRVDASSKDEYKERVERVWDHFENMHLDPANRNGSRYSRCPDATRTLRDGDGKTIGTSRQSLLQISVGSESWDEWEDLNSADRLPPIISTYELLKKVFPERHPLIHGLLLPGKHMVLGSTAKSGKTWMLLDLALSISGGVPWMNLNCERGKVLYADFELGDQTYQERLGMIMNYKFPESYPNDLFQKWFDYWDLEGEAADIGPLVDRIIMRIQSLSYAAVFIDPLYKCLGRRKENDSSDMNDFLSHLRRLSKATGAACIYAHHYRKGTYKDTNPIDMLAGSGVIGRDANTIVAMHPENKKGCDSKRFVMHTDLREFPERFPTAYKRENFLLVPDTAIYASEKKTKEPTEPKESKIRIIDLLPPEGMHAKQWEVYARDKGVSSSTFYRQLDNLKTFKSVTQDDKGIYTKV